MDELIAFEHLTPLQLFSDGKLDAVIEQIEKEARSLVLDISTDKGRKEVASLAYKVAQSKNRMDKLGKDLVADWKQQAKKVDVERSRVWDRLERLQAEVRAPLTEWENKEKQRVADHEAALVDLENFGRVNDPRSTAEVMACLDSFLNRPQRDWEEFATRADKVAKEVESRLLAEVVTAGEREELARLRREEEERTKRDREERIAREAADRARREAEEEGRKKAEAEVARVNAERERERQEVERERAAAEARAKRAEAARDQMEQERLAEAKAAAERLADIRHREMIEGKVLNGLIQSGLSTTAAWDVLSAIASGNIPHLRIEY